MTEPLTLTTRPTQIAARALLRESANRDSTMMVDVRIALSMPAPAIELAQVCEHYWRWSRIETAAVRWPEVARFLAFML